MSFIRQQPSDRAASTAAVILTATALCVFPAAAQQFTIEQALSAPFTTELIAAPAKARVAWEANIEGRRNLWVAEPASSGKGYTSRPVTHYTEDDGQEINTPEWTPDGSAIVYVHGSNAQGEGHPVPNPAWSPKGALQQIYVVGADGGEPRLLAEGHSPAVSPDGNTVAYVLKGQLWSIALGDSAARPQQLLQTRGTVETLRWAPDGAHLAFVSSRDDHSFIAVYTVASSSVTYLDPSTDLDEGPAWSPDSREIAYLRVPPDKNALLFVAHRTALPWSIRVADVASGKGREIFRATEGQGSAYRETDSLDQLHWTAGNQIVFPWELNGWLHLYAVAAGGGTAKELTPGANFEVEHVSLSVDRKTLVLDSNENDIDRRHIWQIAFSANGADGQARSVTSGEGIETQPVVASDGTVAVLRSDVRVPIRPAAVSGSSLVDLAPQAIPADFPSAKFVVPAAGHLLRRRWS